MKTDPTVEFLDDEDDTLYVVFEGGVEAHFVDSETEEFMQSIATDPEVEVREKGLMAQTIEMTFALAHEIFPVIRAALMEQYGVELEEESIVRVDEQVADTLPGFMKMLQEAAEEAGEE